MSSKAMYSFHSYGEVLLRFSPHVSKHLEENVQESDAMHAPTSSTALEPFPMNLSVSGAEVLVAVALARVECNAQSVCFHTSLPNSHLATSAKTNIEQCGVEINAPICSDPRAEMAIEIDTHDAVCVQRRNSAFTMHESRDFDWDTILGPRVWLHLSNEALMEAKNAEKAAAALNATKSNETTFSLQWVQSTQSDYSKNSSWLSAWRLFKLYAKSAAILTFTSQSLIQVATYENKFENANLPVVDLSTSSTDALYSELLAALRVHLGAQRIAVMLESKLIHDDNDGAQDVSRRWSLLSDHKNAAISTLHLPTFSRPKTLPSDGSGVHSAWVAGFLDYLMDRVTNVHDADAMQLESALRRADLMAALCQQTSGPFSGATRGWLSAHEERFEGHRAFVGMTAPDVVDATPQSSTTATTAHKESSTIATAFSPSPKKKNRSELTAEEDDGDELLGRFGRLTTGFGRFLGGASRSATETITSILPTGGGVQTAERNERAEAELVKVRLNETAALLRRCGVIAVLRGQQKSRLVKRGLALARLGCRALEVTMDSPRWREVLAELNSELPNDCNVLLGVGTVMDDTVDMLVEAAALGARFACSPVCPIDFMEEAHDLGIVAIPAGMTSNELWHLHREGARFIKLFHGGMVGIDVLRSILQVGPMRELQIVVSGSVRVNNVEQWLDAGATCTLIGASLVGKDLASSSEEDEKVWESEIRAKAHDLFAKIQLRFPD